MVIFLWVAFLADIDNQWESFEELQKSIFTSERGFLCSISTTIKTIANGRPIDRFIVEWRILGCSKRAKGLAIENWLPIFERGALCVNLQYGDTSQEEQFLKEKGFEFITFLK